MIRNRVTESGVVALDLIDFCDISPRKSIDLVEWLKDGLIIKEKEFREQLKSLDVNIFKGFAVNVFCSSSAIIPTWAYMLIQAKLENIASDIFFGDSSSFELYLFQKKIQFINVEEYKNKRVFIKACKNKNLPIGAFSIICKKLIPHVKSLFYGEPCSSVPLIKN